MNEYKLDTLANKVNLKRTKLFIHASFRILDRQYICSYEERYHETLVLLTERCKWFNCICACHLASWLDIGNIELVWSTHADSQEDKISEHDQDEAHELVDEEHQA